MFTRFINKTSKVTTFSKTTPLFNSSGRNWEYSKQYSSNSKESTQSEAEEKSKKPQDKKSYEIFKIVLGGLVGGIGGAFITGTINSRLAEVADKKRILKELRNEVKEQERTTKNNLKNFDKNIARFQSWLKLSYTDNENEIYNLQEELIELTLSLINVSGLLERVESEKSKNNAAERAADLKRLAIDLQGQKKQLSIATHITNVLLHLKTVNHNKAFEFIKQTFEELNLKNNISSDLTTIQIVELLLSNSYDVLSQKRPNPNKNNNDYFLKKFEAAAYNLKGMALDDYTDRNLDNLTSDKQQKNYLEAFNNLSFAIQCDPNNGYIWSNLGFVLERLPVLKAQALKFHEIAYNLNPGSASILNGYARCLQESTDNDNLEKASKYFDKALELEPNNLAILKNKGGLLLKMNNPRQAIGYLENALKIKPDDKEAYNFYKLALSQIALDHLETSNLEKKLINLNKVSNFSNQKLIFECVVISPYYYNKANQSLGANSNLEVQSELSNKTREASIPQKPI